MEKAYLFLHKLVALTLNVLVFFTVDKYLHAYYTIPVLLIIFSLIISRITKTTPKEIYNYQRSEKFFSKGGLRDLLRIPVMLFAFLHDVVVWIIWGLYQILVLATDLIYFIKEIVFWCLHGIIWFLQLLLPFWRIVGKMIMYYLIKWPWWIYSYAFKAIKKSYNWNILRVSLLGAFLSLFIIHLFYFLHITLDIFGLYAIGLVLAILPISWVFGEIASIRGQKLMFVPFYELKLKMRNGLETVRGILFFITFFVVLLLAEAGLGLLGWIPKSGVVFLGLSMNISFVINLTLIALSILIVLGSLVLPTYRLYNEFSETSFKDVYKLFAHLVKRSLQYLAGIVPSSFFASITIVPAVIVVALAFTLTMGVKENVTDVKIEKLLVLQSNAENQLTDYQIGKKIDRLEYINAFPKQFFQDINHRSLLSRELDIYKKNKEQATLDMANYQAAVNLEKQNVQEAILIEQNKVAINQTRLDELNTNLALLDSNYKTYEQTKSAEISMLNIDIEYTQRSYKQAPLLFYLGGLFAVVCLTLVFAFVLAYYGNFYYRAFMFNNDGTPARWKAFLHAEQEENHNQPLLSTTLNLILVGVAIALFVVFL